MKKFLLTLSVTFVFAGVFAQAPEKKAHIKQLLELTGAGKLGVQASQSMLTNFKQSFTEAPDQFWDEMSKEINSDTLIAMVIPIYDKYYTDDDIQQMIAFYQTPVGKKVTTTLPLIMKESMEAGQEWGKQVGEKVYLRLTEKGYIKKD